MSFVSAYIINIERKEIITKLQNKSNNITLNNVQRSAIGDFIISAQKNGYIHGRISVERLYDDFLFEVEDGFEINKKPNPKYIYDEVTFCIFPDLKIVSFGCKEKAKLFGMELLSKAIFNDGGKIFGLIFYPQKVLDAKKKGYFENVWFNGVKYDGKIKYTGQFGTEIDDDKDFLDIPEARNGLGIVFRSMSGLLIKIAVHKDGSVVRRSKLKVQAEDLKLEKEIIQKFLEFSNYGNAIPNNLSDQFTSLSDFL